MKKRLFYLKLFLGSMVSSPILFANHPLVEKSGYSALYEEPIREKIEALEAEEVAILDYISNCPEKKIAFCDLEKTLSTRGVSLEGLEEKLFFLDELGLLIWEEETKKIVMYTPLKKAIRNILSKG